MKNKLLPFCLFIVLITFISSPSFAQSNTEQAQDRTNFNLFDELNNISDLLSEESVIVYPTESVSGVFTISFDYPGENAMAEIEAFDLFGRVQEVNNSVFPVTEGENEFVVTLNDLKEGGYILKIKIGETVLSKRVFVIN